MPNPQTVSQLSTSFAEIQKNNLAFSEIFKQRRALPELAKQIGLPALADIFSATYDKSLVSHRVRLVKELVNDLKRVRRIPNNIHDTAVEFLRKSDDQVNQALAALIMKISHESFGDAEMEAIKSSFDVLGATIIDQYGINLFYQYLSFQGQIHCPVMIEIYNAISSQNSVMLLNQREEFIKKISDTIYTIYFSTINAMAGKIDVDFAQFNELLANKNYEALFNAFDRWTKNNVTQDILRLSEIAKFMLDSIKNKDIDGIELSKRIWDQLIQWRDYWFESFSKDIGRDGFIVKDTLYPHGKKISFVVDNGQVYCNVHDLHVNWPIKKHPIYTKKPGENDNIAIAKACAEYLRNEYHLNNELIAYILSTLHQGGYVQGYFSLQKNLKPIDGYFFKPPQAVPELIFDQNQQLQCIAVNQHFYTNSIEGRSNQLDDNVILGNLSIIREYPGKGMQGNEPLEYYIPGTFPPDEGKVSYTAKHHLGWLNVTPKTTFEKIKDIKPIAYIHQNPFKAGLFFVVGCLVAAVGIAAWPATLALLSGASAVGAAAAVATFITTLATPVLAGLGVGTLLSGFLGVLLPGIFSKPAIKQPVRLVQGDYPEYVKDIIAGKKSATVISTDAAITAKLTKQLLDELRIMIELINDVINPKGKEPAKDLTHLDREALRKELSEQLIALDATICAQKVDEVFKRLIAQTNTKNNAAPITLAKFIEHLETLNIDALQLLIPQMKKEAGIESPRPIPGTPPRAASPHREGAISLPHTQVAGEAKGAQHKSEADWQRLRHAHDHATVAPQTDDATQVDKHSPTIRPGQNVPVEG